jgi:hypothetical protein
MPVPRLVTSRVAHALPPDEARQDDALANTARYAPAMLPPPATLERTCKGLALLDAILCEDWQYRLFSFNAAWSADGGERMASMRNGQGDEWFIVFVGEHAFFKAFWHEHPPADPAAIFAGLPSVLEAQRQEPAFSMEDVTFGGWYDPAQGWTLRGDLAPFSEELAILSGSAEVAQAYVASYFEVALPLAPIEQLLRGAPLDAALVAQIAPDRSMESLQGDTDEVGYGPPPPATEILDL